MLYKPNSVLGREAANIRVLTVLIFREKEYFRTFASVCERPKKPTCLLAFVTNCSVLLEMRTHTHTQREKTNLVKMTIQRTQGSYRACLRTQMG